MNSASTTSNGVGGIAGRIAKMASAHDLARAAAREARSGGQPDVIADDGNVIGSDPEKQPKLKKPKVNENTPNRPVPDKKKPAGKAQAKTTAKPAAKPAAKTPAAENARQGVRDPAQAIRRDTPTPRDAATGRTKPKPKVNEFDARTVARDAVRRLMAPDDLDEDVLENVQPSGQDPDVDADDSPESEDATAEVDENEEPSNEATRARRQADVHLRDARQALLLEAVLPEDEIDALSDERLLALGKLAKDATRQRNADLREANKGKKSKDAGSQKPDATQDDDTPADNGEESDEYEALAKKHFGDAPEHEWFRSKLGAFTKEILGRNKTDSDQLVESVIQAIEGRRIFADVVKRLSVPEGFPQLATPQGQEKILPHMTYLQGKGLTFEQAIERACLLEFGERGAKGKVDAKAKTLASKRDTGSVNGRSNTPTPKGQTPKDVALAAVRSHMIQD